MICEAGTHEFLESLAAEIAAESATESAGNDRAAIQQTIVAQPNLQAGRIVRFLPVALRTVLGSAPNIRCP